MEHDHDIKPVDHEISWPQKQEYTITDDNRLIAYSEFLGQSSTETSTLATPHESQSKWDTFVSRARFENGVLTVASFLYSYETLTRVKINGRGGCEATRVYKLKPGFSVYIGTLGATEKSSRKAENIECSVATTR